MGSRRDRQGSFYMMIIVGAIVLIGFVGALQVQLDQQMARARRMKGSAEAALIAREGIAQTARKLSSQGSLPARTAEALEGGDLVVVADGPLPAGSRKYVVFARARFPGGAVTAVADVRFGSQASDVCNLDMLYQDVDVDAKPARALVIGARRQARAALKTALVEYRGEGSGLAARLTGFLSTAAQGTLPRADQTRISSVLVTPLTTDVP